MNTNRIKPSVTGVSQSTVTPEAQPRTTKRRDLHAKTGFDKSAGRHDLSALDPEKAKAQRDAATQGAAEKPRHIDYRLDNGELLEIPQMSQADEERVERIFSRASPDKRVELERSMSKLGGAALEEAAAAPAGGDLGQASGALTHSTVDAYTKYVLTTGSDKHAETTQGFMKAAVGGVETYLQDFFGGLQKKQAAGAEVRTDVTELRGMIGEWPADGSPQHFTYRELETGKDGSVKLVEHEATLTRDQAQSLVGKLEQEIETAGTVTLMDQNKLQVMVNKYQQAITTLSNIIKSRDEQLRSVISNIRA